MAQIEDEGARGALVHITVHFVRLLQTAGLADMGDFAKHLDSMSATVQRNSEAEVDPTAVCLAEVGRVLRELDEDARLNRTSRAH